MKAEARAFVQDLISYLESSASMGSTVGSYVKVVTRLLTWNDIESPRR